MWLGEQITERGIGNGITMIIVAGIVAGLPRAIGNTLELVRQGEMNPLIVLLIGGDRGRRRDAFSACSSSGRSARSRSTMPSARSGGA